MKRIIFWILLTSISGCASTEVKDETDKNENIQEAEPPVSKRIYYFQHKLIPKWVFESSGEFFFDLNNRNPQQLIEAATDIVNAKYANEIVVTPIANKNAVSIRFPEPNSLANCYFALIIKEDATFSYYTYEKTLTFGGKAFFGVVGGWDHEGSHYNYGPRSYMTEEEFIEDILNSR